MSDSNDPPKPSSDLPKDEANREADASADNVDELKSNAQDAAEKMVEELQAAFKKGREDAGTSFEGAADQFKEIIEKGAYSMGFGGAFASQFVSTVLKDVMPETVRKGAEEGAERGRTAGEEFKSKVTQTTDGWREKAKDAEPADGDAPEGAPA